MLIIRMLLELNSVAEEVVDMRGVDQGWIQTYVKGGQNELRHYTVSGLVR